MKNRGFTLIEVVVVLAVVAILAAILVPTIEKNIRDAKITRATNEVQVIAAAMASFYKDVGEWPVTNSSDNTQTNTLLETNDGTRPDLTTNVSNWDTTTVDTFDAQLVSNPYSNPPKQNKWDGPYINELKADPWGYKYVCNIADVSGAYAVFVLSAGSDGYIDTEAQQSQSSASINSNDIGVRIR